jgi:molecular chaperone DnaK
VDDTLKKADVEATDLSQILLVGGQTRTLAVRDAISKRYGRPLNTTVKPEEAVARGAAVVGARLCGFLKEQVNLWDANPLSLGVELADGSMDVIIPANQQIPIAKWRKQAFTTQRDGQASIQFNIYQGERPMAADNTRIGEVSLPLATSRPAGEHRINCLFKVDENGILTVRAESADGEEADMTFVHGALSATEVQAKLRQADEHQVEDELTRLLIELNKEARELRAVVRGRGAEDLLVRKLNQADVAIQERDANRATQLLGECRKMLSRQSGARGSVNDYHSTLKRLAGSDEEER